MHVKGVSRKPVVLTECLDMSSDPHSHPLKYPSDPQYDYDQKTPQSPTRNTRERLSRSPVEKAECQELHTSNILRIPNMVSQYEMAVEVDGNHSQSSHGGAESCPVLERVMVIMRPPTGI